MKRLDSHTRYLHDAMLAWRHDIHKQPELAFEEQLTSDKVAKLLDSWDIEVHRGIGSTGIVGVLKRGHNSRSIGLRADMDALRIKEQNKFEHCSRQDGKMHACGHDGHTAMLLGAARHLAEQGQFDGTVIFVFQPAEEHGEGALAMINDGLFDRFAIDAIYAMHNFPSLSAGNFAIRGGTIMAAEDNFEIVISGRGCHAAMPHLGEDSIVIAAEIVTAMQSLVARTLNPMDHAVVSITEFITNGTTNVLPDQVILKGDARSLTPQVQNRIETTMARIVAGICNAHGAKHSLSYRHNFVPTINSVKEAEIASTVASAVVGEAHLVSNFQAVMISEDFGFMLQHKPGAYVLLGNGDLEDSRSLHNPLYDFNDEILCVGADFWVELVQTQLQTHTNPCN